ncbi:kunitz-type protease inhibitor 1a isoform 2-T2 [Spinachia spinachia]
MSSLLCRSLRLYLTVSLPSLRCAGSSLLSADWNITLDWELGSDAMAATASGGGGGTVSSGARTHTHARRYGPARLLCTPCPVRRVAVPTRISYLCRCVSVLGNAGSLALSEAHCRPPPPPPPPPLPPPPLLATPTGCTIVKMRPQPRTSGSVTMWKSSPGPSAMGPLQGGQRGALLLLLLLLLLDSTRAQDAAGTPCHDRFKDGRSDFVLDADESVKDGATFISSPALTRRRDCVASCCKEPQCNVAFMERGDDEGTVKSCFLFDCVYNRKYACRFVRKTGYVSSILDSVYESYLERHESPNTDHPPVANGGPDRVVQPHETVTLNGMASDDDHKVVSHQWKMLTSYPFAVIEKTTFDDEISVSNLTSGVYKFQLTVTDAIGQSDTTKVTVLVLTPEQSEHHCMAPKKVGPCRGSFPRWHYNGASEKCEAFTFGGCSRNLNNYLSEDECTKACAGSEKPGKGGRHLQIGGTREKCGVACGDGEFACANGCCLGPGLECDSTEQCSDGSDELKCDDLKNNFRILLQIPVNEQKVRCTEHPDTGNCRDSWTKWYYDPLQEQCFRFNYGGCQGNDNRFDTEQACLRMCRGVTENDVFARKKEYQSGLTTGNTGVIAIAVLLGVAIFILLCLLVYCLMKGKKKTTSQRHRTPANAAPVRLEDREHLVYNSTTKPI